MFMQLFLCVVVFACAHSTSILCSDSPRGTSSPRSSVGSSSDKGSAGGLALGATIGSGSANLSLSPRGFSEPASPRQSLSARNSPRGSGLASVGAPPRSITPGREGRPTETEARTQKERFLGALFRRSSSGSLPQPDAKPITAEEFITQLTEPQALETTIELLLLKLSLVNAQQLSSTSLDLAGILQKEAQVMQEINLLQQQADDNKSEELTQKRLSLVTLQAKLIAVQQLVRLQNSPSAPATASTSSTLDPVPNTGE